MFEKKIVRSLFCLAVVLSLSATGAMGGITFEGLVAHLKFDGDADDELGNVIAATFVGAPVFGAGVDGQALFLNGQTDYVDLGPEFGPAVIQPLTSFSISVWAKGNNVNSARVWPRACQFGNSDDSEYVALLPYSGGTPEEPAWGAMGGPRFELKKTGYGDGKENNLTLNAPNTAITPDEWANIVVVLDADRDYAAIYVNGELVKAGIYMGAAGLAYDTNDFTRNPSIIEKYDQNYIGNSADNSLFYGGIDDLQIYNRVLSPAEIELIASGPPELAGKPKPRDGAIDVPQEVTLTWRPGEYVEGLSPKHRIFFSENFDDVNDGIGGIEQDVERYPIDGSLKLDLGKTCYWRVDEANSTSGWDIGDLWRFTVIDHLAVDDFENYTDYSPNIIYETWLDGWEVEANGSTIGYPNPPATEQSIVHGGRQSMPFFYDNGGKTNYSEAKRTFNPAQDWTREGVEVLSLWFKGHPLYVGGFTEGRTGTYTMTASGTDIWSGADEFHFAFKQVSGAASIIAKVESMGHTDPWAKAGVMIRDTLEGESRNVAVLITPENGVRFQYRDTTGGVTERYFTEGITAPQWVKLERTAGGLVRGYYSEDGTTWELFSLVQVRMDMPIYVGLAVTSHNTGLTCEAKFSNVSFPDTSVDLQWTNQDVGMLSNEAQPMYVSVEDGSGTAATVYHDDPDAALINTWTEWNINLKEFGDSGVVLTDVSKLSIGFGDKENLQPGGSGTMFFDDIRLYPHRELPGANIIWVTRSYDHDFDGIQDDQEWIDWLAAEGHTVDVRMGYWTELDPNKVDELNAADLVIMSRSTSSGDHDDSDEPTLWNSVMTPLITMNGYLVRSSRWRWMDTTSIVMGDDILLALDPNHPLFDGVTLERRNTVIFRDNIVPPGITSFVGSIDVGNGTLIAQTLNADQTWIAEWAAGVEFYAGSGQTAGGPRLLFVAGTQESGLTPQGAWDLTTEGEQMFRNAINYMVSGRP